MHAQPPSGARGQTFGLNLYPLQNFLYVSIKILLSEPSDSHSLKKGQGAGQKKGTFDA